MSDYVTAMSRVQELEAVLDEARTAIRWTREYAGEDMLPALPGWEWFDVTQKIDALIGACEQ